MRRTQSARDAGAVAHVVAAYPGSCQPQRIEPFGSAGGFSGARFWRIETRCGPLCLRRWPCEHPTPERLQWIHAVLRHIEREGFRELPVPLETRTGATYVVLEDALWQLEPWLPGTADSGPRPPLERITAALTALARLHQAAESFRGPTRPADQASPGIAARRQRLGRLRCGGIERLGVAIRPERWPALALRARRLIDSFWDGADAVEERLTAAAELSVPLQPCLRDVWSAHILFVGAEVTGVIDFGAMRVESVAADVSRLLGSMAGGDRRAWRAGLAAYQAARPLGAGEETLVEAFDQSNLLMAGLQWIEWVYVDDRQFDDQAAILTRIDRLLKRLSEA